MAGCSTTSTHMLSLGSRFLPLKAVPLRYAQNAHQRLHARIWRPKSSFSTMRECTRFVGFHRGGGRFVTCSASSGGAAAADYSSSDPWTSISEAIFCFTFSYSEIIFLAEFSTGPQCFQEICRARLITVN